MNRRHLLTKIETDIYAITAQTESACASRQHPARSLQFGLLDSGIAILAPSPRSDDSDDDLRKAQAELLARRHPALWGSTADSAAQCRAPSLRSRSTRGPRLPALPRGTMPLA